MLKSKILELLFSSESSVSGEEIANRAGVSRNAVWKAVRELREEGFSITASTNKGYEVSKENKRLCAEQIRTMEPRLSPVCFETVDSTNKIAKEMALQGAEEYKLVVARTQSAGRGRLGRKFFSYNGGLYLSLVLRPKIKPQDTILITTAAAVAAAEAIERFSKRKAQIKWVNDIYVDNKKVCGILTEGAFDAESGELQSVVLGVGINMLKCDFPEEIRDIADGLLDEKSLTSQQIAELIVDFCKSFMELYVNLEAREFIRLYRERSWLTGKTVEYIKDGLSKKGKVLGIDDNAALVVESEGEELHLTSGEVTINHKYE